MPTNPDPWLPTDTPTPPGWGACLVQTFRVTEAGYEPLPNVECVSVQEHEGPDPGTAVFRYRFGFPGDSGTGAPQAVEEALSTLFTGGAVVEVGDRLAVLVTRPDGQTEWIFDGFPLVWSGSLGDSLETVTMTASGLGKRCWDTPLSGVLFRDSASPTTVLDIAVAAPGQFNPRGKPNASPPGGDAGDNGYTYPTFMDPDVLNPATNGPWADTWTLNTAAAYLCFVGNTLTNAWVQTPARSDLDDLLFGREPSPGAFFDPTDSSTYTASPIAAPDTPFDGKAFPVAVHELVGPYGFGTGFFLGGDYESGPTTTFGPFLKQAGPVKWLYLDARLSALDAGANNLAAGTLSRDLTDCVNQWLVVGGPPQYEVTVVLAAGFPMVTGDAASASSIKAFDLSDPSFATSNADKYRTWILSEDGSAHYPNGSATPSTFAVSLDAVLGAPVGGTPRYVKRRRAPIGELISKDPQGRPLRYRVAVSTDYSGSYPAVWDGSGTWQTADGGFDLLDDRVGIRLTVDQPNGWFVGLPTASGMPYPAGVVNAVEKLANAGATRFYVRLTCVIEGDDAVLGRAPATGSSPIALPVTRTVDARDRYVKQVQAAHSEFNTTGSPVTVRDDTPYATAEAIALRTDSEQGVFEAEAEIPYLTRYYGIGDRIAGVQGRGLSFQMNSDVFAPVYPIVVGRRWDLADGQRTVLTLSDSGLHKRRPRPRRAAGVSADPHAPVLTQRLGSAAATARRHAADDRASLARGGAS